MAVRLGNHFKRFSSTANKNYVNLLDGINLEHKIGTHGSISIVDTMPRIVPEGGTGDLSIVQAARLSYGDGEVRGQHDNTLIRFLMRHQHTSPFEMVEVKFRVVAPIFVVRQWIRHRTANVNEWSGRYTNMPNMFYRPEVVSKQSESNKQCSGDPINPEVAKQFNDYLDKSESIIKDYDNMLNAGVSREQSRIALPLSNYTQFYWKCDLHNIFNFLRLRMANDAQYEIREYADAMFDLVKPIFPVTCQAFEDYQLNSIKLTGLEVDAIKNGTDLSIKNKREKKEFEHKLNQLGLNKSK